MEWFLGSIYWIKVNYMLGLMQLCGIYFLYILVIKIRVLCEWECRKQRVFEDGVIDRGMCFFFVDY